MNDQHNANPWMLSTVLLIGLIAGFGVAQIPYFKTLGADTQAAALKAGQPGPNPVADQEPPPPDLTDEQIQGLVDDDAVIGNAEAPITLVEFSDFQCPYCSRFYNQSFGQIEENYIKTGKVKFVYRDFPLEFHQQAMTAALAYECAADQDKAAAMHDVLFERQTEWSGNPDAIKIFQGYAAQAGADTKLFNSCLESKTHENEVKKDLIDGVTVGVTGTPTFFIDGKLISGAMPYEEVFKPIFEAEIAGKEWELSYDPATRRPVVNVK